MATKKIKKQNQKDNDAFSGVEEYIAARESDLGDYETIALDKTPVSEEQSLQKDVIYDNMKIELEHKTNPSLDGVYETLQTLKIEENSNNVSKCIRTREAKQKVLMFVLVMMAVAASITSLVITLMNTNKVLAVDGSWASWESWEACSSTCDYGMQKRQRNCSNPRPLGTGQYCVGLATEHRLCTPGPCLILTVDGSWASWESWEACSRTCDLGMQKRQRNCSNPRPLGAGQYCVGVESEHRLCMPGPCLNGGWSAWGVWSECSASCDIGLKSRNRACNNPVPSLFGDVCEGENTQQDMCSNKPCNDGGWSAWGVWSGCSASCDGGLRSRSRACNNPKPSLFGVDCEGENMQQEICSNKPCNVLTVDGSWASWESWEACSRTCDLGMQKRQRKCSNPRSSGTGQYCVGEESEHRLCTPGPCLNGGWSAWGVWSGCSASCDTGLRSRSRACNNPKPSLFGDDCEGENSQQEICNNKPCNVLTVDGSWASWESWEACSRTCDFGMQKRQRNCSNPRPTGNGQYCVGAESEHRLCMPGPCLNGGWSAWGVWSECSVSCDGGFQSRSRTCNNPRPSFFGDFCEGENTQQQMCLNKPCNDGGWSAWGVWSECSVSCDGGLKLRSRACNNPRPSLFGDFCEGENTQQEICRSINPCNDGGWSAWGLWSECSASCDGGHMSRSRACNNPRPSLFGEFCKGENTQQEMCRNNPCNEIHVAFSAYQSSLTGNDIASLRRIIFTTILFNEGGAYNKASGNFVAPFSGLYQFNAQICTMVGPYADYALVKEGISFASGEFMTMANATDGKCTSFSAVAVVQSQEKVWVESHNLFQNSNDWNAFSGILIHRT